jgi:hypothetical protein
MVAGDVDFVVRTAMDDSQFARAGHFLAETDTTCADNTAGRVKQYIGAEVFLGWNVLHFDVSALTASVPEAKILEVALASLIADRAIERVVDEQELQNILPRLFDARRIGPHDEVILPIKFAIRGCRAHDGRATRCQLTVWNNFTGGGEKDMRFHKTHAAVSGTIQPWMIAIVRHLNSGTPCGFDNVNSVWDLKFKVVQFDECHDSPRDVMREE